MSLRGRLAPSGAAAAPCAGAHVRDTPRPGLGREEVARNEAEVRQPPPRLSRAPRGGESRTRGIYASTHRVLSVRGRRPVGMRPVGTPISSRFTRRRALTDMTFPSSLLGPTSRAQVDGPDPADGSKTSGHRCTWSVYELSRVRIERIEHHGGPGQDRLRLRRESKSHLESISFDVRPSVHSGRLRGPSGLGPSPRAGTHGVALHFEIIAHYTFSCPAH